MRCPSCGTPVSWAIRLSRSLWPGLCPGCGKALVLDRSGSRFVMPLMGTLAAAAIVALFLDHHRNAAALAMLLVAVDLFDRRAARIVVGTEQDARRTKRMAWAIVIFFVLAALALWFIE